MRTIETARLLLRPFRKEDAADCFAFLSDRDTCWLDGGYEPFDLMDEEYGWLMDKFASQPDRLMIQHRASGRVTGTVNILPDEQGRPDTRELGYVIAPAHRRRGYAAEALEAVMAALAEEGLRRVTLGIIPQNEPSLRLAEKLGFIRTGEVPDAFVYPPVGRVPLIVFERLLP